MSCLCPAFSQELKSSTPFPAFGGYMGGVSRYANNTRRILAYQFLSLLASPTLGWEDVLSTDPAAGVDPYRDSQLLGEFLNYMMFEFKQQTSIQRQPAAGSVFGLHNV